MDTFLRVTPYLSLEQATLSNASFPLASTNIRQILNEFVFWYLFFHVTIAS